MRNQEDDQTPTGQTPTGRSPNPPSAEGAPQGCADRVGGLGQLHVYPTGNSCAPNWPSGEPAMPTGPAADYPLGQPSFYKRQTDDMPLANARTPGYQFGTERIDEFYRPANAPVRRSTNGKWASLLDHVWALALTAMLGGLVAGWWLSRGHRSNRW